VWTTAFASGGSPRCHRNLLLVNNTIAAGPGSALLFHDLEGALVAANTITRCGSDPELWLQCNNTAAVATGVGAAGNQVHNETWPWLCAK